MSALPAAIDAHERAKRALADVSGIASGCFGIAFRVVALAEDLEELVAECQRNVEVQRRMETESGGDWNAEP